MEYQDKKSNRYHTLNQGANLEARLQNNNGANVLDFQHLIDGALPKLKRYIVRRLNMAHATGAIYSMELSAREIMDSVYLELFERLKGNPQKPGETETFLYRVADEVLEKELNEKAYEKEIFVNVNHLLDKEILDMEEKFTIDAEGELVMIDELDDVSYQPKLYGLNSILPEDPDAITDIERTLEEYDKKFIHQEIRKQLLKQPEKERTIFDLFWLEEMDLDQIAKIRKISIPETEDILKRITKSIKEGLERRFKNQ